MKKYLSILFFSLAFLTACGDEELHSRASTNFPPKPFQVTTTLQADNKTIFLTWTAAVDPDGDNVSYDIVLDGKTLVVGLKGTSFILASLDYNIAKEGKIIAKDTKGLSIEAPFKVVTKGLPASTPGDFISIPDANFENALVTKKLDTDGLINGKMARADAIMIEILQVPLNNIVSLQGIDFFINLKTLDCSNNKITTINLAKSLKLESLNCSDNALTSLDVSTNSALSVLDTRKNFIKEICVSNVDVATNNKNWTKEPTTIYKKCN